MIRYILVTLLPIISSMIYAQNNVIPITITPIYQFDPILVNTPDYQEELTVLSLSNVDSLTSIFAQRIDSISIESLFVFSIRLYDLGKKDEAVFWFHNAKIRAILFSKNLDPEEIGGIGSRPFELKQAFIAFSKLAGEYINGYAGGDVDLWIETLARVKLATENLTDFNQYPELHFIQEDFQEMKEERLLDYDNLIHYLEENKKEIKQTRKKNKIDGKY